MTKTKTQTELLKLLRQSPGSFVSGADCSLLLGVSRTTVWKQMGALRDSGYEIEAVTSRGYRLLTTPDLLRAEELAAGLEVQCIGRDLCCFEETDSTNLRAHQLGEAGAVDGTVVIADRQTAGKGRLGRSWESPGGVNLYLSVLLRPPLPPRAAPQLTFLSALAVARTVEQVCGFVPAVKWPNDILLRGKKVAGLLNEMSAETERIHFVILGIGVNLNMAQHQFPADLRYPATSLALERGSPVARLDFCRRLLTELDRLYQVFLAEGVAPIIKGWLGYFALAGREVEVDCQPRRVTGRVEGIDADGALLLRLEDGSMERILAGDVRPL